MQAEVLAHLRNRPLVGIPDVTPVHRDVIGEWPIHRADGQVIAFVDAVEIVTVGLEQHVYAFEIKPVIDTAFGIVRQLKAIEALIASRIRPKFQTVFAVVRWDDPKLGILRKEWPATWAWGIQFQAVEP